MTAFARNDPTRAEDGRMSGEPGEKFLGVGPVDGLAGRGFQRCVLILAGHEADRGGWGEGDVVAVEHVGGLGDLQQAGQRRWGRGERQVVVEALEGASRRGTWCFWSARVSSCLALFSWLTMVSKMR